MATRSRIGLITSYPQGTGIYRFGENLFNLGYYAKYLYLKSINVKDKDDHSLIYEIVKPLLPISKAYYPFSFVFKSPWSRGIMQYEYIHMISPDFFHLSRLKNNIIGTIHDLYAINDETKMNYSAQYRFFQKMDLNYCYNLLGISIISRITDTLFKKFFPNVKTRVIHHWTPNYFISLNKDLCRKEIGLPSKKFILLNVSYHSFNKNLNFLAELIDSLTDNFLLIHLGDSEIKCNYPNRTVNITNHLDDATLVRLYNASDLYLAPSISEGFNRPVIEAVNCGLPVLATDIDIFREVLMFSPYLLPLNISVWRDVIISLTDNKEFKAAVEWYVSNIGDYYREERGKKEYTEFYHSLGVNI
jgi:glycosyltransferase involved in cell wall biosynthesis